MYKHRTWMVSDPMFLVPITAVIDCNGEPGTSKAFQSWTGHTDRKGHRVERRSRDTF